MIKSITLYPSSLDLEKMETILSGQIASMKKENGLLSIIVSEGNLMSPGGPSPFAKVLETSWDSLENFMAWVQKQTQEEHANKDHLIEKGAVLLFYEVNDLS